MTRSPRHGLPIPASDTVDVYADHPSWTRYRKAYANPEAPALLLARYTLPTDDDGDVEAPAAQIDYIADQHPGAVYFYVEAAAGA